MTNPPTTLIFCGWLKALTSRTRRTDDQGGITLPINRRTSIKDLIESFGVPHTEVGAILVDEEEVTFDHIVGHPKAITIMPLRPPVDVLRPSRLRPLPLPTLRFLVDANVGKLAGKLRMAGFDTSYPRVKRDEELAELAAQEQRLLLSKDVQLLKRKKVLHGHLVREIYPQRQLAEIIHFYDLLGDLRPFTRCLQCNELLKPMAKDKISHRLEPLTKKYYQDFHLCPVCDRLYWPGSHRQNMDLFLTELHNYQPPPY